MTQQEKTRAQRIAQSRFEMHQRDQERQTRGLQLRIESLMHELQHALENIAQGDVTRLNSLGIVQGQGSEIDRLIGQIHLNAQWLKEMREVVSLDSEE